MGTVERTATLCYQIGTDDDRMGKMVNGTKSLISVNQNHLFKSGIEIGSTLHHQIGSTLHHPNFLQILFLNQEGGFKDGVYESYTQLLRDYIKGLGKPTKMWVYKEQAGRITNYISVNREYRRLCKQLVEAVNYMHSMNVSFGQSVTLEMDRHFVVDGDVLKIRDMPFRWTSDFALQARRNDYRLVAEFIRSHILVGAGNELPDQFSNLIRRMTSYSRIEDGNFILNHIALQSSTEKLIFIQNLKNKFNFVPFQRQARYTKALLALGNNSGWLARLETEGNPNCFYCIVSSLHKKHVKDAGIPAGSAPFVNHMRRSFSDGGGRTPNVANFQLSIINRSLITMCRNLATHLSEDYPLYKEGLIVSMILSSFGKELEEFQKALSDEGILKYFISAGHDDEDGS